MANTTMEKFGYPNVLVGELESWAVLLRPMQSTLGCLVLACREDATSLGAISAQASQEFGIVCQRVEALLSKAFAPDKLNYLALMMVDPHVHFHVIPRYEGAREWPKGGMGAREFVDVGWPKVPDLGHAVVLEGQELGALVAWLRGFFPR